MYVGIDAKFRNAWSIMLNEARIEKGLTQAEVCKKLQSKGHSISQSAYSAYERGRIPDSEEVQQDIYDILEVSPDVSIDW